MKKGNPVRNQGQKGKLAVAASFTVYGPGEMTDAGRRRVAKWLVYQAGELAKWGEGFGKVHRARYCYGAK